MREIHLFFIISAYLLSACEKDNTQPGLKSGTLDVSIPDTAEVRMNDTLLLNNAFGWISLTNVPQDSRCPVNAQCVWAGDAIAGVMYFDGSELHDLELHTHPKYQADTMIHGLYFKLLDLSPHPFAGKETNPDDYRASIFITDDTAAMNNNEYTGTVVDYTGLDGCGYIIELDNGKKLEPAKYPVDFRFYDGQRVLVDYKVIDDVASICMVGDIVEILTIEKMGCPSYPVMSLDQKIDELPSDEIMVKNVNIENGCIRIEVGYSGGCKEHEIELVKMPLFCGTPPIPDPIFYLTHDANGDLCEAFITEEIKYDLKLLKNQYPEGTDVVLMTTDKKYSKKFHIDF